MSNRFLYEFPKFSLEKRIITLPLFLLSIMVCGESYYIKNGGNNLLSGKSESNAWESIGKVNSFSFSPGDSILFKRGDKFIGTLTPPNSGTKGNYIVFGAYGEGEDPIITPNDYISNIKWVRHSGSIYKTTDIKFNPGNMLIDGTTKINKINDYWMTHTPTDGRYGNYAPLQLLATDESYTVNMTNGSIYFWDGLDALYCYDATSGTTYLRFRRGDDPNYYKLAVSVEDGKAIYIGHKSYITIQNLHIIGGEWGVYSYSTDVENIIIEDCYIESSNRKIYIRFASSVTVRNNTITNKYLSPYTPCAYASGITYKSRIGEHYYLFGKYRIGISQSTDADDGIGGGYDNNLFYGNKIINCTNGIGMGGGAIGNSRAYDNYIEGTSSVGISFGVGSNNCFAHDNYLVNTAIAFRFQYVDDITYPSRTNYIYRNKIYIPDAGELVFIHYGKDGPSLTQAFLYHNSVICKTGLVVSAYANDYPNGTGFVFINNIISASGNNMSGPSSMATKANLFKFYYNWVGGTYYGAGSLPGDISLWATDASNLNHVGKTFWDHSIAPPDFKNISGTEVIDAGIDVSKSFTLGGVNYSALPGISSDDYNGAPDIGVFEYSITNNTRIPVANITITGAGGAASMSTDKGTLQLSATVLPADATNKTVTWSLTNGTGQATISTAGLVTAIASGTVTAKATAKDGSGVYGTMVITISNQVILVTGITVTGAGGATTITTDGGTLQLGAAVLPVNADNKTVTWSITGGSGFALLNSSTGLLTAIDNGSVTVRATANDGSGVFSTMVITISNQVIPVTRITVTGAGGASSIFSDNGTLQLNAAILPSNTTNKTVVWSISNGTGQATINIATGLVTAIAGGTVTAKATAKDGSGVYGTLIITISNQVIPVTVITVTGAGGATTIAADGGTLQLSAAVLPANATNKTVTWSITSGSDRASVNATTGLVTAKDNGSITVRAIAGDGSGIYGTLVIEISNQLIPVVPVYVNSAIQNATPSILEMIYDVSLANVIPDVTAFKVEVNSVGRSVIKVTISGAKVMLTIATPVIYGDVVTVAYTKPVTASIQTSSGGKALTLGAQTVSNNVIIVNTPPVIVVNFSPESYSGFVSEINATGSYDVNKDILTYTWTVPANVPVSSKSGPAIKYLGPIVNTSQKVEFTLRISDGKTTQSRIIPIEILPFKPELETAEISGIEASGYQSPYYPYNIIDGNIGTMWSANGDNQWLILELKQPFNVQHVKLAFQPGQNRESYFDILGSEDKVSWEPILTKSSSCAFSGDLQVFEFPPSKAVKEFNFVKLIGLGNSTDSWNYISELKIFGYPRRNSPEYEKLAVKIYPNPAKDHVTFRIDEPSLSPDFIQITDLSGTVLYTSELAPDLREFTIPINLNKGIYIVQLISGNLTLFTQKLVVSK